MMSVALLVFCSSVAALCLGGAFTALRTVRRRRHDYRMLRADFAAQARSAEIHWAITRFSIAGLSGDDLQEQVCRSTNASPTEVSRSIAAHPTARS